MAEGKNEKRLISVKELCSYVGLGRSKAVIWGRDIGAEFRIGRRSLFDKQIIDKVLNEGKENGSEKNEG